MSATERHSSLPAGRRWLLLCLLSLGALIAFIDRTNISAALTTPEFKAHFALSDLERGWVNSAFFWSYALLQYPMGWVTDRYGVKWPYAACFAVWCLATAATGLADAFWALIVLRLVVGASEAVVVPATYRWIRNNYDPRQSGAALGFYALGTKLGPALGAPIGAWLILQFNWQIMFVLTGLAGLLWLVPWLALGRGGSGPGESGNAEEMAQAIAYPLSRLLFNPLILSSLVVYFCYSYFTFFCMTWMPAYLVEQRGLSLEEMGLYAFFSFAGIAIVALVAGWLADEIIRRGGPPVMVRKAFILTGFTIAGTILLGARAQDVDTALFWNVVSLSGLGLATANNLALCSIMLIPAPIVGRVKGIQNTATAVAGIVSPLMTGWLLELTGSFVAPMTLIFAFLVLGALTVAFAIRPQWAPRLDVAQDNGTPPSQSPA